MLRLVDRSRSILLPNGRQTPRVVLTYVRYPAHGLGSPGDQRNAPASRGPFPLVVFGHGFAVTPNIFGTQLRAWARAGFVVAAPLFPLGNANAPGGPNEADIVNQPRDMSLVISRLLTASADRQNPLSGLIDAKHIAVAGHSDGANTALAAAYDRSYRDSRVTAAVSLSGARIPGSVPASSSTGRAVPLLAVQGTADTINPPALTRAVYDPLRGPRFLLTLFGAGHLAPYIQQPAQATVVRRVVLAFLARYLKGDSKARNRMFAVGRAPGIATLTGAG